MNQGLQGNDNENLQIGALKSCEPQILDKKQGVALKNTTPLQIGEPDGIRTHDPLIKSQMLYQLSYGPAHITKQGIIDKKKLVNKKIQKS